MKLQTQHALTNLRSAAGVTAARLAVNGLDEANAQAVGDELARLAETVGTAELRLDLCDLDYLSSVGLGKLLVVHKRLRADDRRLSLHNVRPVAYEVFEVSRLAGLLDVRPAVDESGACA